MIQIISILVALVTGEAASGYSILYSVADSLCTWSEGVSLNMVATIYDYVQPLGLTLALCFAVAEMMEAVMRSGSNNVTAEIIIMPLLKFGIAYLIIAHGIEIISLVFGASNAFCSWVDTAFADISFTELSFGEVTSLNGVLVKVLFEAIPGLMSLLSQIIAMLIIGIQLITIRIEVLVRTMFFHIAVADLAGRGMSGSGMRYMKNLLGNIFLLGTILIVIKLTYMVSADIMSFTLDPSSIFSSDGAANLFSGIFAMVFTGLLGPFACISAITTVKSMIREVFAG